MSTETASERSRRIPTWLTGTITGAFGLLYAYAVWNALDFLILQASGLRGLNGLGWLVLGFAVLFPIIVFAVTFGMGRRRGARALSLMLLVGLGLVAVFWLDVLAYSSITDALLNPLET
ncbi:hypothetical protein [Microbacterium xanthum]|uniref:hypothetical protein n=1 Tax=Microbacterium xanthum TaxID=3079794 RepID=UPI002AD2397C|nr:MULTISPECIES: hypothetical protein [unclassified Microbacterium]MDZ8172278.1 hypothetical protein [Microbacterium sp. KSW-48]MDZ8202004.1 hypothetical protein [Microbacterium sp. SSW1-59]